MDAGKAAAVTSASMAPPSAPVRRTAPSEAVKGYQGSKTPVRESGAEDTVELSTQGRMMAQKLAQPQTPPQPPFGNIPFVDFRREGPDPVPVRPDFLPRPGVFYRVIEIGTFVRGIAARVVHRLPVAALVIVAVRISS